MCYEYYCIHFRLTPDVMCRFELVKYVKHGHHTEQMSNLFLHHAITFSKEREWIATGYDPEIEIGFKEF